MKRKKEAFSTKEEKNMQKWLLWMQLGAKTGCHQRSDRSFFYKGYQFPICARCTGVFIGYLLALLLFRFTTVRYVFCIAMNIPMLIDGGTQFLKWRESTQVLRVITGIMGGYGILTFQLKLIFSILF